MFTFRVKRTAVWMVVAAVTTAGLAEGGGWSAAPRAEPPADGGDLRLDYGTTRPGDEELLVPVSVWGEVQRPGAYNVPDGTNLVGLLSYAGGPTVYANLGQVKLTRPGGAPAVVSVETYLVTGATASVPVLQPGDTVYVSRNARYGWKSVVEVFSQLAIVAGTVLLYVEVTRGK